MQFTPQVLATIKHLPLLAKTVVDGFMSGFNKSTIKGSGLEFSQYRSYQAGDDLRWLDWRMFARSDRYYIRESEVETSIAVRFLVDASASMNHEDKGIKKIDYARWLAAALACLAGLQGDATGLYIFQNGGLFTLASKNDSQHLQRLYHHLENIQPEGTFTQPAHYRELFTGASRRELLVVITDMYQPEGELNQLLDSLAALRHEIIVLHLMADNELTPDFKGYTTLEDLETGQTLDVNTVQATAEYQKTLQAFLADTRRQLLQKGITYRMMNTGQPLDAALHDFLTQRKRGG